MDGNQPGVQLIESEEDKKKKGPATQPGSAFAPTGPSASSAPSGTQQARAAQAAGPTRGTGFTGVGRFLQANVGSRLGQEVAGRVSQAGQQAASRLGQAAGQFQQQLGQKQQELSAQQQAAQAALQRIAGGVEQPQPEKVEDGEQAQQKTKFPTNQIFVWGPVKPPSERFGTGFSGSLAGKYNKWQSQIGREDMPSEEEFLSSLTPDEALQYKSKFPEGMSGSRKNLYREQLSKITQPVSLTPSEQDIAAYQAVASGQIQAPTGLQDVEGVRAQAQLASQLAKGTQTATGRTGLLQQMVGRGPRQYTAGQSALDALILGQAGGQLAQARRSSAGLERQLSTQERLAEEQARQFGAKTKEAAALLKSEAGSIKSPIETEISSKLSKIQTERPKLLSGLEEAIEKGELTKEQANILGISEELGSYGLTKQELKNLIRSEFSPADITAAAVSTPEQAAKLAALSKLTGLEGLIKEDDKKIGTIQDVKQGIQFDPEKKLKGAKESAEKQFEQAKKDVLAIPGATSSWSKAHPAHVQFDSSGNPTIDSVNKAINWLTKTTADPEERRISPNLYARYDQQLAGWKNYIKQYQTLFGNQIKIKE